MVGPYVDAGRSADPAGLQAVARRVAREVVAEHVDRIDRDAAWPAENVAALADAGLLGLHAPRRLGGHEQGMLALALVTEELGQVCPSTAIVYGMHCVGTKVIAAKATADHDERYLGPIAAGQHVTSLAVSEPGTGVHFYIPRTTYRRRDTVFCLDGTKGFVTSGGHADSYLVSAVAAESDLDPGTFSCLLVDRGTAGLEWLEPWDGFGMRGNSSRSVRLDNVEVPLANLLGEQGDETWYVFEVIAPYFLVAMAGTYVGLAQAALDTVADHLRRRTYTHTGSGPGLADTIVHRLGEMWTAVQRSRQLLHHAASLGDQGDPGARPALFACKAEVVDSAVWVANEAMTLAGGVGYGRNSTLARLLRDARAGHVMSPTTDLLKIWLGRLLLDLPIL